MASTRKLTKSLTRSLTRKLTGAELERLFLEKFKFTLGSELITNGDFSASAGWTELGDASINTTTGLATIDGTSQTSSIYQNALVNGKTYTLTFTVSSDNGTGNREVINNDGGTILHVTGNGSKSVTFTHSIASGNLFFKARNGGSFVVDNVSVKEVTKQAPLAAFSLRKLGDVSPYAARIRRSYDNTEAQVFFDASDRVSESSVVRNTSQNLLAYSENFGEWTLGTTPERIGGLADPFGGNNAWSIKSLTSGSYHHVSSGTASVTANSTHTLSWYVKKETSKTNFGGIALELTGGTTKYCYVSFDEVNGTATNTLSTTSNTPHISVTEPVSGWYRFAVTLKDTHSNNTINVKIYSGFSSNGTSLSAVAGSARTIFGAQLEETVAYESTGTEKITNGDFSDGTTGYDIINTGGTVEVTNGALRIATSSAASNFVGVSQDINYVAGKKYKITFDYVHGESNAGSTGLTVVHPVASPNFTTTGSKSIEFVATTTAAHSTFFKRTVGGAVNDFTIDNVSILEFDPIASEYISTPVVSNDGLTFTETTLDAFVGGENLLPYSNEFTHYSWTNYANMTANRAISPTGENNASEITTQSAIYDSVGSVGGNITVSIHAKKNTASHFVLSGGYPTSKRVVFDLETGVACQVVGGATHTSESLGNGWFRFSVTVPSNSSADYIQFSARSSCTYAANNRVAGVYVYGAQINTGSTLKPYQETTGSPRDGNAGVVVLYNQTGGQDAIQATQGLQPLLYSAGLLVRSGTSAAINFIGGNPQRSLVFNGLTGIAHLDAFFVHDSSDNTYIYPSSGNGSHFGIIATQNSTSTDIVRSPYGTPTLEVNGTAPSISNTGDNYNALNGRKLVYHRSASTVSWAEVNFGDTFGVDTEWNLGAQVSGGGEIKFAEIIFFDSDQHSNQEAIEKDINDFHNIF